MNFEYDNQTICALATAVGGALAVIRLSGAKALEVARRLWHGHAELDRAHARRLMLGTLHDENGVLLDQQCLAVYMPGPESYTGEDVVELHGHGGALQCVVPWRPCCGWDCVLPSQANSRGVPF